MPRHVSSVMEFETKMDPALGQLIRDRLAMIGEQSPQCTGCELRKSERTNGWIIECRWRDTRSMHAHVASQALQGLINLLISRSTRIAFGYGSIAQAQDTGRRPTHCSSQKVT